MKYIKVTVKKIRESELYLEVPDDFKASWIVGAEYEDQLQKMCERLRGHDWIDREYEVDCAEDVSVEEAEKYRTDVLEVA